MAITKTERTELRRIVKNRFNVLREQIAVRQNEIANQIRQDINASHEKEIQKHSAAFHIIHTKAKVLDNECKDLVQEMLKAGLSLESRGAGLENAFRVPNIVVKNLNQAVGQQLAELKKTAGSESLDLSVMEMELDESIALDSLESDAARAFLSQIPTVEALLPLPASPKQLKP